MNHDDLPDFCVPPTPELLAVLAELGEPIRDHFIDALWDQRAENPFAVQWLEELLEAEGDWERLLQLEEERLAAEPDSVVRLLNVARLQLRREDGEAARPLLERALALAPGSPSERADALMLLGGLVLTQALKEQDEAGQRQARLLMEEAVALGQVDAHTTLGTLLLLQLFELDQEESLRRGLELLHIAALADDGDAQFRLAEAYRAGHGTPQNWEQAQHWLEMAAALGHGDALRQLAHCYAEGLFGVAEDLNRARQCWRRLVEQDDDDAAYNLAVSYLRNTDSSTPEEIKTAIAQLHELGDRGHAEALELLSMFYEKGVIGGLPNPQKAREFYERALAAGLENLKANREKK